MTNELEQNLARSIIHEPNKFSRLQRGYDPIRNVLKDSLVTGKENLYSQIPETDRLDVLGKIQDLFEDRGYGCGGTFIHLAVYKPFAFNRKFTREVEHMPGRLTDAIIPVSELGPERMAKWEKYLESVKFLEKERMLVAKGIQNIPFPTIVIPNIVTSHRPQNVLLAVELERAKREIVTKLLPNIKDEEAQVALGLRYTAKIATSSVTPHWFVV